MSNSNPSAAAGRNRALLVPVDERDTDPGYYTGKPLLIEVAAYLQVGEDRYEDEGENGADWDKAVSFDVTESLASNPEQRDQLLDTTHDDVYGWKFAEELVQQHRGIDEALNRLGHSDGYTARLQMEPQEICEWLDDNPPWEPGIPHPTGGYTHIDVSTVDTGAKLTQYSVPDIGLHRTDGPAQVIIRSDGRLDEVWATDGKQYNPNGGPSRTITYKRRTVAEEWTNQNGALHRKDGPAVHLDDGTRQWWRNGEQVAAQGAVIGPARAGHLITTDGAMVKYDQEPMRARG